MTRARPTRGTDSITLAKPNETSVHIVRPKPAPLRQAGLQAISTTTTSAHGKPLISPVPSQAELLARRKSERLERATDCTPVRNSTMRGPAYTCLFLGVKALGVCAHVCTLHILKEVGVSACALWALGTAPGAIK